MKPEDVKVVNVSTGNSHFVDNGSKSGMHGDRYLNLTRKWKEDETTNILKLLSYIPGVKAHVTVKLDTVKSRSTTTLKPDNKGTAVSTTEKEITRDQEGAAPAGRPGSVANTAIAIRQPPSRGSKENESESESTTTNVVGGTTENETDVGMTPVWMSATVIVPHSYLVNVWKQENPTADGEEPKTPEEKELGAIEQKVLARVKESVVNQLPDMKDVADKTSLVTVTVARDIKPDPLPEPSMADGAMSWLSENWGMVGHGRVGAYELGNVAVDGQVDAHRVAGRQTATGRINIGKRESHSAMRAARIASEGSATPPRQFRQGRCLA